MSYVIHVFAAEPPSTLDEALRLFEGLHGQPAAPRPHFVQLAQALIERFPAEVGGQDPLQPLWLESVPDGDTYGSAVYSLGLYDGGIQGLLPALVSQALKLGLCVLDEQAGRCYVPDAWVLTAEGRHRLKFQAPPPPPADETVVPAELTLGWVSRRLLAVVGAALAPEGFVGRLQGRGEGVAFSRSTEGGLQHLLLWAKDRYTIDVTLYAELEPELPFGLHRACLLQPKISCQVFAHTALQPYQEFHDRGKALDDLSGYTISLDPKTFDAQALAIVNCLRDEYLPLLKACSTLPGILRTTQDAGDLPGRLQCSRAWLALAHWAGADDVQAHAEAVIERHITPRPKDAYLAVHMRRSARRMAALPALRGAWRPPAAWRPLPTPADEAPAAEFWAQAWPRLLALAQAQGFVLSEPEPRHFRLERLLPDVRQWVQFRLDDTSVGCELHLGTPVLHARWKALLAPFGQGVSPRGRNFAESNLLPDRLDEFDVDRQDLSFGTDRRDFLADRVRSAEAALAQFIERIFDPTRTLAGVAARLQPLDPKAYKKGDATGGDFERWACWLLLAAEHRPELVADMATLAKSHFDMPRGMYGTYYKEEHEAMKRLADEALRLAAQG